MFNESTFADLFYSTVNAFPKTTKRQNISYTIQIPEVAWTAYKGVKTLFGRTISINEENGNHYRSIILIKNIDYSNDRSKKRIILEDIGGEKYTLARPSITKNDILVRCNCPDFNFRFKYYNKLDHSLYGSEHPKYVANGMGQPANPKEMPGMCKHLIAFVENLMKKGLFVEKS